MKQRTFMYKSSIINKKAKDMLNMHHNVNHN